MKKPHTDPAYVDDQAATNPIGPASSTLVTVVVPVAKRQYRIRALGDRHSVIMTRPNSAGGVDISREQHLDLKSAIDRVVEKLLQHFQDDFEPIMTRFDTDYPVWITGKPGIRPRSPMWRKHLETIGNHLCRLGESYALSHRTLVAAAESLGCHVPVPIQNHWLEGAQETIERGLAGKHLRLEDLVRKTKAT